MNTNKLPIGYWLKLVDQLLTSGIDEIQASFGLTRTDWQILNAIAEHSSVAKSELIIVLQPLFEPAIADASITQLSEKGLIVENGGELSLSNNGRKQYTVCLERQKEFRQKTMTGISQEDYQTTVATLEKIANNLNEKLG